MYIYAQAADGAYRTHINTRLSKQAGAFRVHSTSRTCFYLKMDQHLFGPGLGLDP